MTSHPRMQRLGGQLACSSRRVTEGRLGERVPPPPPRPNWLLGFPHKDSPGTPAFSSSFLWEEAGQLGAQGTSSALLLFSGQIGPWVHWGGGASTPLETQEAERSPAADHRSLPW